MSVMIGLLLGIGGANAETLMCTGANLSLTSCGDGEVNIDCGTQTSCTVKAQLILSTGTCVVQRVEGQTCEVTVVASSASVPAFLVTSGTSEDTNLTLRDIQPQCNNDPFLVVEPQENAKPTKVTLERLQATTACSKKGPLLATVNESGKPSIVVAITESVLANWTSEGWDSSDGNSTNEGGLISLDNTVLNLTGSVLADNFLSTSFTSTGGGFISAAGVGSVVTLTNNLFVLSNAATQDIQGTMFRLASGAQAEISHNLFIDKSGVTADYAPLISLAGASKLTLEHNLFYGVDSSLPVGTGDGTIPTLNNNLFLGLQRPWQIEADKDSGIDVFAPNGANNWAQAGITDDVGEPLNLGELQLLTLAGLWAELYPPEQPLPTTHIASLYDDNDPTALAIWPDSCSPLLAQDPVPGVLGGGGGAWVDTLDVTTDYGVTWYCSDNVLEWNDTYCFKETADHCGARLEGFTCKTVLGDGDECTEPPDTDSGVDDTGKTDDSGDTGTPDDSQRRVGAWFGDGCSSSSSPNSAALPLLGILAFVSRRRRR
jgi:MYXO-CTERM domain-containing protein